MSASGRLEAAKEAIISQINAMYESNGRRKLGIVTFENTISIIGDGVEKPHLITDNNMLNSFEKLITIGKQ